VAWFLFHEDAEDLNLNGTANAKEEQVAAYRMEIFHSTILVSRIYNSNTY
jgi:hypothetical protein